MSIKFPDLRDPIFGLSEIILAVALVFATLTLVATAIAQLNEQSKARSAQVLLGIYNIMRIVREYKLELQSIEYFQKHHLSSSLP